MRYKVVLYLSCFVSLLIYTQDTFAKNQVSIEDVVRSLKEQEARLEDLDICYTTTRQFLKRTNIKSEKREDGTTREKLLGFSNITEEEREKWKTICTYHELSKKDKLFLEQLRENLRSGVTKEMMFSRNSEGAMFFDKVLGHGTIRKPGKNKKRKISGDAVLHGQFFKEFRNVPITTQLEKSRINNDYPESTINGIKCVVADYPYYSETRKKTIMYMRFWLDPNKSFLPVRMVRFRTDGEIREQYDTLEYTKVEDIWLPIKGIHYAYMKGEDQKNVLANTLTMEVDTGSIKINSGIPDEKFKIEFPQGTQVWDEIVGMSYVVDSSIEADKTKP